MTVMQVSNRNGDAGPVDGGPDEDEFGYLSFRLSDEFFTELRRAAPKWGFPAGSGNYLGEYAWLSKYARRKADGTRERFWEGARRVIEGMYSIQKDWCTANLLPWDEDRAQKSAAEAYVRLFQGKWSPPGRGLWMMGTRLVNEKRDASPLQNCFRGDTRFITTQGVRTLEESVGEAVTVWTATGWSEGDVRSFGSQRVQRITFAPFRHGKSNFRNVEVATPDHRWVLRDGSLTTQLKAGDVVPAEAPEAWGTSSEGFRHGFVFGDGSQNYRYQNGDFSFMARMCGDKGKHAHLFDRVHEQPNCDGDLVGYCRTSVNLKAVPDSQDNVYLHDFILGWAAADGTRAEDGKREESVFEISMQDATAARWLELNAPLAGFIVRGHSVHAVMETNYGKRSAPLHKVRLVDARKQQYWTVMAIEPLDEPEEVYCAVVPGAGQFTLASGILTSNCSMVSTVPRDGDAAFPYVRAMDMSMMGVGVGFDTKGAGQVTLHDPGFLRALEPFVIPDSREGWVASVDRLLRSFFEGRTLPGFDYSRIRPAGAPIRGFGGTAAGPEPLRKGHEQLRHVLQGRAGQKLTSRDVVDIMNIIGKLVVSGNVRRSAQIAQGAPDDDDFLQLKNWELNPHRMGKDGWGHLSNNSVFAATDTDLSHLAGPIAMNGEPGVIWLDTSRAYGRLADPASHADYRIAGYNPCAEQGLEDQECCTLAETYPTNCAGQDDYNRTLKFAYLYAKTVTLLPTHWPETNAVMQRNRRIGTSMTGIVQFFEANGMATLTRWQDEGYTTIRAWDRIYSEWLGVRESVKVTTVKPSGTVSLVFGVTPGVHWPKERGFYVRTIRETRGGAIARAFGAAGYRVEESITDPDTTVVIYLPVEGPDVRPEREVSLWEKASLAATSQRYWSDNSVSVTVTFREDEKSQVGPVLSAFAGQLKTISFLPDAEGVYAQAPYQRVSKPEWDALRACVTRIDWAALYADKELPDAEGEKYCSSDVCEIPKAA